MPTVPKEPGRARGLRRGSSKANFVKPEKLPRTEPVDNVEALLKDFKPSLSKTVGPEYKPAPEASFPWKLRGKVHSFKLKSKESSFYSGVHQRADWEKLLPEQPEAGVTEVKLPVGPQGKTARIAFRNAKSDTPDLSYPSPYERKVQVYVPPELEVGPDAKPVPFLLVNDGVTVIEGQASAAAAIRKFCGCCGMGGDLAAARSIIQMLERAIEAQRVPPIACILVDSGGGDTSYGSQRGMEYDACDGKFAKFVEMEVLPAVEQKTGIRLTTDPKKRAVMGTSSGAAAAFSMAWHRPDLFTRVLAFSGSFVNLQYPYDAKTPNGCWDYHGGKQLIANAPKTQPLLRVGLFSMEEDFGHELPEATYHNWTLASHRMASALKKRGHAVLHVFCRGAVHTDNRVFAQELPGALAWLWK